jgi:hypothetical protein
MLLSPPDFLKVPRASPSFCTLLARLGTLESVVWLVLLAEPSSRQFLPVRQGQQEASCSPDIASPPRLPRLSDFIMLFPLQDALPSLP